MPSKILDRSFIYHPASQHANSADEFKRRMAARVKQAQAARAEPANVTPIEKNRKAGKS